MESKPITIEGSLASVEGVVEANAPGGTETSIAAVEPNKVVTPVAADVPAEKRKIWPMVAIGVIIAGAILMTLRKGHAK